MGKSNYQLLDQAILEYVEDQRKQRLTVTEKKIRIKAASISQELYPDLNPNFKASRGWFNRMCTRNNLSHRRVTSVGQKVPENAVEIAEEFLKDMMEIGEFSNFVNMDETPCSLVI